MQIKITKAAKKDISEIFSYYKKIDIQIALNFYEDFERQVEILEFFPDIGSLRYADNQNRKDLKFLPLTNFPYLLFFRFIKNKNYLRILRIIHGKRDIGKIL